VTDRSAYIEEIRVRALRLMQDRKWQVADLARGVAYKERTVLRFIAGEPAYQTSSIAAALAAVHRDLDDGMNCPHCGRPIT